MTAAPIYHLAPASYYHNQPPSHPYRPKAFAQEGFIHCTAGVEMLLRVANAYFADLNDDLLALHIDPQHLVAPLKFEAPAPPLGSASAAYAAEAELFPHIYGPLERRAIISVVTLQRDDDDQWQWPG